MKKILIAAFILFVNHYVQKFLYEFFEKKDFCKNCKIYTECNRVESLIRNEGLLRYINYSKIFCSEEIVLVKSLTEKAGDYYSHLDGEYIQFIEVSYPNEKPSIVYSKRYWPDKFTSESLYKVIFKPPYIFLKLRSPIIFMKSLLVESIT